MELGLAAHIWSSSWLTSVRRPPRLAPPGRLCLPRGVVDASGGGDTGEPGDRGVDDLFSWRAGIVRVILSRTLDLGVEDLGAVGGECGRDRLRLLRGVFPILWSPSNLLLFSRDASVLGVLLPASIPLTSRPESTACCSKRSLCLLTKTGLTVLRAMSSSASLRKASPLSITTRAPSPASQAQGTTGATSDHFSAGKQGAATFSPSPSLPLASERTRP